MCHGCFLRIAYVSAGILRQSSSHGRTEGTRGRENRFVKVSLVISVQIIPGFVAFSAVQAVSMQFTSKFDTVKFTPTSFIILYASLLTPSVRVFSKGLCYLVRVSKVSVKLNFVTNDLGLL